MKYIAHRGASLIRQENTVESLVCGAELGAYAVECDIRVTADGRYIIFHDPDLARKYRVASIPTLIVFENGAEVRRSVGVVAREDILDMLGIADE